MADTRADNRGLGDARTNPKDEFYTQLVDIEAEMNVYLAHNPHIFAGKAVLCPCDHPEQSNFAHYFRNNFQRLGLSKLVVTSMTTPEETPGPGHLLVKTQAGEQRGRLRGDGDFRSPEITAFKHEADVVVNNPPFSLFREFIDWLMKTGTQFSVLGNMNAVTGIGAGGPRL